MNIGIMGFGHLGRSLAEGLLLGKAFSADKIFVTAKSLQTKNEAVVNFGVNICNDNNALIEKSDIIFICLKSDEFFNICSKFDRDALLGKTIISFMAGVKIQSIKNSIGNTEIIRAMPNVSINICNGIIGYTPSENKAVINLFGKLGYAFAVEESEIEKVTSFASCGVGFAAYFLNCFLKAGMTLGFDSKTSGKIVSNIFENALKMSDYEKTVSSVATKGGATEEGIKYFDEKDVNKIIFDGIYKAYEKML